MKIYGYIRVSTKEQNTERQYESLNEYALQNKIKYTAVFKDKASGKNFNRQQYQALKEIVRPGDIIIIKELDRLGRNYDEIKQELADFSLKGVKTRILDLPQLNVEDPTLGNLLNNLVIELLSYIAQKEREKIVSRVREGLINAKEKGIKLGRPARILPKDFVRYYKRWKAGEVTAVEFGKLLGVSRSTLYRYIREYEV